MFSNISVVVPTFNEESNIHELVKRVHTSLSSQNIHYEIIFVDDFSTDKTREKIAELSSSYPISIHLKNAAK